MKVAWEKGISEGIATGGRDDSQREEFLNHRSVLTDLSSECGRKDFLQCGGPEALSILAGELCQHLSAEGRD